MSALNKLMLDFKVHAGGRARLCFPGEGTIVVPCLKDNNNLWKFFSFYFRDAWWIAEVGVHLQHW